MESFNPFSLEGRTIIITGASSGIGKQCAIDCSKMGAKIILIARNEERLKETLSLMNNRDNHAYYLADFTQLTPDFITFLRHHIAHNDNQRVT